MLYNKEFYNKLFTFDYILDNIECYYTIHDVPHCEIFLDECNNYKDKPYPLIAYFRNSYSHDNYDFVPITVSDNPEILIDVKLQIFKSDLDKIKRYLSTYQKEIKDLADLKIYNTQYEKIIEHKMALNESVFSLNEMASLKKFESGLPLDIWLDDDKLYKKHGNGGYKIKIEPIDRNKTTSKWPSMRLFDKAIIDRDNQNYKASDLNVIKMFIDENEKLIKQLADGEIDIKFFKKHFKTYNNKLDRFESQYEEPYYIEKYITLYNYI